jgi:hypothetical protein
MNNRFQAADKNSLRIARTSFIEFARFSFWDFYVLINSKNRAIITSEIGKISQFIK